VLVFGFIVQTSQNVSFTHTPDFVFPTVVLVAPGNFAGTVAAISTTRNTLLLFLVRCVYVVGRCLRGATHGEGAAWETREVLFAPAPTRLSLVMLTSPTLIHHPHHFHFQDAASACSTCKAEEKGERPQ